jgi:GNAT superfamily N-acetyltransferase
MLQVTLREGQPTDFDAIALLWHDSWANTGLATPGDPTVDEYRERLDVEEWRIRVARVNDRLVGFTAFDAERGWLRQIFVSPDSQRKGVGSILMADVRRWMPEGFFLRTDQENQVARRFYEQEGFRLQEVAPHPILGVMTCTYVWP